nr:EOG090X0324 [Triops cancriformis]
MTQVTPFESLRSQLLGDLSPCVETGNIEPFCKSLKGAKYFETDKKAIADQVFRDEAMRLLSEPNTDSSTATCQDLLKYEQLVQLCCDATVNDCCSQTMPVILLSDIFDALTLDKCEALFSCVETKVSFWKQDMFFAACKNNLLRLCNDLLRRLSRSQNTVFCGRILLFLAKFFPFSERSGLNIISEFNLDNVTSFGSQEDGDGEAHTSLDDGIDEDPREKNKFRVDYNFYRKFWALQDFFRNPNQCYSKAPWKSFATYSADVLSAFLSYKLDQRQQQKQKKAIRAMNLEGGQATTQHYFAKYLTNQRLLELQLGDSNFRRYVLLQFLILFQYLECSVKFKQDNQKLNEEQSQWVKDTHEKIYSLLEDTPPDGPAFAKSVQHILKREELWSNWKNEGCQEFRGAKPPAELVDESSEKKKPRRRLKRKVGDQVKDAVARKKVLMGNAELTRLWNLCPDNMQACRSKERDFLPLMEEHFAEAIEQADPSKQIEPTYKLVSNSNYAWRALRLLARKTPHFFTQGNTQISKLPDYLENLIKKVAKDFPQNHSTAAKAEPEEPELEQIDAMPTEAEDLSSKDEETRNEDEEMEEAKKIKVELCTLDQLTELAKRLGNEWKRLGPKLGFRVDEIEYFESENSTAELQAKNMLQIWLENEGDDATPDSLLYTLEGLGLKQLADGIFTINQTTAKFAE